MSSHSQIRILSRERPRDASALVVSASLPRVDFAGERVTVGQAAIKALAVEDADLDFRHVQPTGVLWRVVKDDASQELVGDPRVIAIKCHLFRQPLAGQKLICR